MIHIQHNEIIVITIVYSYVLCVLMKVHFQFLKLYLHLHCYPESFFYVELITRRA